MAHFAQLAHAQEIQKAFKELMLKRSDIGYVSSAAIAQSRESFPPPCLSMTDADVRATLEPEPIKWHKDLIRNYRTTSTPETIPYYRYSTDKQHHSIEHQQQIVAEFLEERGAMFKLPPATDKLFADPETSGKSQLFERRWGGQLASYVRPGDHIVCAYFDRIGRTSTDTLNFLDKMMSMRVFVHIIDHPQFQFSDPSNPSTVKAIQEAANGAEHERKMIARRTARAAQTHLAKGVIMGCLRHRGWTRKRNHRWNPEICDSMENPKFFTEFSPDDAAVAEVIWHLFAVEGWLVPELCAALRRKAMTNKRYLRSTNGKPWDKYAVKGLLRKMHAERFRGGAAGMFAGGQMATASATP
jgi:DNA invertase Pin-like site-specific DNA recombinase